MKKLSRILSLSVYSAGFTMIELLVVIAVIGVLAVAVLSSINPIEQINKGRDTRTRSDAAQLINAVDRYYAIHEEYPWNTDNPADGSTFDSPAALQNLPNAAIDFAGAGSTLVSEHSMDATYTDWNWVDILVDTAEVKEGFVNRLKDDNKIFIVKDAGYNETMYACFMPTSKAFVQEAADNCSDGTTISPIGTDAVCDMGIASAENLICLP